MGLLATKEIKKNPGAACLQIAAGGKELTDKGS
jgi:hypothetical protein